MTLCSGCSADVPAVFRLFPGCVPAVPRLVLLGCGPRCLEPKGVLGTIILLSRGGACTYGNALRAMLTCKLTMQKPSHQYVFYIYNIVGSYNSFEGVSDPAALHTLPAKVIHLVKQHNSALFSTVQPCLSTPGCLNPSILTPHSTMTCFETPKSNWRHVLEAPPECKAT